MNPQAKLALRRFALRWLRYFLDWCDERLHAAEVRLREDLSNRQSELDTGKRRGLQLLAPEGTQSALQGASVAKAPAGWPLNSAPRRQMAPRSGVGNPACPVRENVSNDLLAIAPRSCEDVLASIRKAQSPMASVAPSRGLHKTKRRRGISARAFDLRFSS